MNKFVKYFVLPFVTFASAVGISSGVTYGLTKKHDKKQLQVEYNKGYQNALTDEEYYNEQLGMFDKIISEKNAVITDYSNQIAQLTSQNIQNQSQISTLQAQVNVLTSQKESLEIENSDHISQISSLNSEIARLTEEVNDLMKQNADYSADIQNKENRIASLNNEINGLQKQVDQLNSINQTNLNTITSLNVQINNLNSQISDMTLQSQNSSSQIAILNNKINDLQTSINYYETYLESLENGEQVVATFEYDGSVYNVQVVNKNSLISVVNPSNTDYMIFNGWKVNGEMVDLTTYTINQNTRFVADITYKYDVKFMVDESVYDSQIIIEDENVVLPSAPSKDGYVFEGWSLNGVDVITDISSVEVKSNTTYYAVFSKCHIVTFMYEDEVYATQTIKNGNFVDSVNVDNTDYKVFNGWKVNGVITDLSTYKIYADTIFVADITYKFDVKFMFDDVIHDCQYVVDGNYSILPSNPEKEGYQFVGWSLNGVDCVDVSSYNIESDTIFVAIFVENTSTLMSGSLLRDEIGIDTTTVVFDYYTDKNNKTYVVDGVDLINNVNAVDVSDNSSLVDVNLYKIGTTAYILSTSEIYANSSCSRMFMNFDKLVEVNFNNFNTSKVSSMYQMFYNCYNLVSLDLSDFDTSNVTDMSFMFYECSRLTSLDLSSFDTSKVSTMSNMFHGCSRLISLNLSSFNTLNVWDMSFMFNRVQSLSTLDLSSFNTANVSDMSSMFAYGNFSIIYIGNSWTTTNVSESKDMFLLCDELSNFDSNYINKTYAYAGGYLTLK